MKPDEDFNFDEWALLEKADPTAFELRRRSLLDKLIHTSGRKESLGKSLQREIDDVRNRAVTPQDALQSITEMMNDQLVFLGEELDSLRSALMSGKGRRLSFFHCGFRVSC